MAYHIEGPVRTLPGHLHPVPRGTVCDHHPAVLAAYRIQGETDSMGAECADLCSTCGPRALSQISQFFAGQCERCRTFQETLKRWRDPEEGTAGRVYQACEGCREESSRYMKDEAQQYVAPEEADQVAEMVHEFDPSFDPDDPDAVDLPDSPANDGEDDEPER